MHNAVCVRGSNPTFHFAYTDQHLLRDHVYYSFWKAATVFGVWRGTGSSNEISPFCVDLRGLLRKSGELQSLEDSCHPRRICWVRHCCGIHSWNSERVSSPSS